MEIQGRRPVVPLVLFFLFFQVLAPSLVAVTQAQSSAFVPAKGVVISELLPFARGGGIETEYLSIYNAGGSEIDVGGWRICDEHHCAILVNGTMRTVLDPTQGISIAQNATIFLKMKHGYSPTFAYEGASPLINIDPLANGSLWPSMVNDGDYIWIEDNEGTVIDAVAFGKEYQGPGWTSKAAPAPRIGWTMVREHRIKNGVWELEDTNTSADWPAYRSRRAEHITLPQLDVSGPAKVTALKFPEDGGVFAGILQNASRQVLLNTYQITSFGIEDILSGIAKRGIEVRVLVEGHPVGGLSDNEKSILWDLDGSGCKVRLVGSTSTNNSTGPFGLDHAKYMVIDESTTIVMSENLVGSALGTSNTSANRGWGLSIQEEALAKHLRDLFYKDWALGNDVKNVIGNQGHGQNPPSSLTPRLPASSTVFEGNARIISLVTPDFTEDVMISLINGASRRLYIELLSCDLDWHLQSGMTQQQKSPFLEAVIDAARRGVDVKILLDSAYLGSSDNEKVVRYLNEIADRENLTLAARLANILNITVVHNKGMIVDDTVLVSSINWVDSAVRDNREVGIAVTMEGLDELYISYFMKDWEVQNIPPTDGPGPDDEISVDTNWVICGSFLAFAAVAMMILAMMRRKRH